jgi:uncharacterized BrkB/YihY/UPF0761 family membrane protein
MTMNESTSVSPVEQRKWWVRLLWMLVMAIAFQLAASVLVVVAVVQLVLFAVNEHPHERLRSFGRGLGRYLGQIAEFVTLDTDALPFPFADWPA